MKALCCGRILLRFAIVALHDNLHLLDGGNNHHAVFVFELLQQVMDIIGFVHINDVIFRISLEGNRGLLVEVFAVNQENGLVNPRNQNKILGHRVGG